MILQIPVELNSEFMLDMLQILSIEQEYNLVGDISDEERYWAIHALYFFGGVKELDNIQNKAFIKFHTSEQ